MRIQQCALWAVVVGYGSAAAWAAANKPLTAAKSGPDTSRGDAMIAAYFQHETEQLRENCLADVTTLEQWEAKREVYRRQLFEMLGLDPRPEKCDLKPVITGRVEHDDFVVEKLQFQSRPGLYVTGTLYLPKKVDQPAPTILYVCGHAQVKKNGVRYGNKAFYQHHGCWFASNGYVCLTIDTLQLGEIKGIHHGTYRENRWWWNSRGYTPAGVEAWNCIRALDYLQTRKEVDTNRIGMTGRSGGGAYTWTTAALDTRIKVAVPVAGITDLTNHVVDGCVEGHCDCMFPINTYRWDYPLMAALIAPRPLLFANSDKDKIFPLDGVMRTHERLRRIYQLYQAEDALGLQISEGPHKDTQELQVAAFRWFNRFLKNTDAPIDAKALPLFEPEQLKVFSEPPSDQLNTTIDETFVPKAAKPMVPASQQDWDRLRDGWMESLRTKCFAGWPQEAGLLELRQVGDQELRGLRVQTFEYTSQHDICLPLVVASQSGKPSRAAVLVVPDAQAWDALPSAIRAAGYVGDAKPNVKPAADDVSIDAYRNWLAETGTVCVYAPPRGIGPTIWNQAAKANTHIRRRFMLLGQTVDGMRVWDVRRAMQAAREMPVTKSLPLRLQAERNAAGIALYASLFEPAVAGLDLTDLPGSHREGPIFLNVLKYLDIPQAVAIAGERTPVIVSNRNASQSQPVEGPDWTFPQGIAAALNWPNTRLQTP